MTFTTEMNPSTERPVGRYFALLTEFDGTDFVGWQEQLNLRSVQGTLRRAISRLAKEPIVLTGCSRTDSGVHAAGHVSSFCTTVGIPTEKWPPALNSILPDDISVIDAFCFEEYPFDARREAMDKQYSYLILNRRNPSALLTRKYYFEPRPLDVAAMNQAAASFIGRHDFRAFMATGSEIKTTIRTIYELCVESDVAQRDCWVIRVRGDGFLYNMVRIIAGTLVEVGLGKIRPEEVAAMIVGGERKDAGLTLPAKGLRLDFVTYKQGLFGYRPLRGYNEHDRKELEEYI